MYELVVERHFAAAHFLPDYPGKCSRLHGHNYRVRVFLRGPRLDARGLLIDFGCVKAALDRLIERLDHQNLNDLAEFAAGGPSTENVARVIAEGLAAFDLEPALLHRVEVWETPGQGATYYPRAEAAP